MLHSLFFEIKNIVYFYDFRNSNGKRCVPEIIGKNIYLDRVIIINVDVSSGGV